MWVDGLKRSGIAGAMLIGAGQLALGQEASVTGLKVTTVVCASEDGREIADGTAIIVLQLAPVADGWAVFGDFAGSEVLVKDQKRFTVIGPNYVITVYHTRGAFVAVQGTTSLFCKELLPNAPG